MPDDEQPPKEGKPEAPNEGATAVEGDRFGPDAIAARVDSIGEESELDRQARLEERRLLERKKAKGKKGLETAASKRLAKIGQGKVRRPGALADAVAPEADPLLERTARLVRVDPEESAALRWRGGHCAARRGRSVGLDLLADFP